MPAPTGRQRPMPSPSARAFAWLLGLVLIACASRVLAGELPEYRLKAAFIYNFALFTEWPAEVGNTLNLCVVGKDPFGEEIDPLNGKPVGARTIAVQRKAPGDPLKGCQVVFIAGSAVSGLQRVLEGVRGSPVLTIADTPGAASRGVALNMNLVQDKVTFEANMEAARNARLTLSSKLLRLATEVRQ
jgi:hypothetical protein